MSARIGHCSGEGRSWLLSVSRSNALAQIARSCGNIESVNFGLTRITDITLNEVISLVPPVPPNDIYRRECTYMHTEKRTGRVQFARYCPQLRKLKLYYVSTISDAGLVAVVRR